MAHTSHQHIDPPGELEIPKGFFALGFIFLVIGIIAFVAGVFTDPNRAWKGYVIGFWFTLSLGLAGPFFIATQYLSKAGWSVAIRRIPEAFGAFLWPALLLGLIALFGIDHLYYWLNQDLFDPTHADYDAVVAAKEGVLHRAGMWIATLGSIALLAGLAQWMRSNSLKQDETADAGLSRKNLWISAAFLVAFVIGISLLSWYWLMSFNPHWYSTMWSVYAFSGLFQTGLALMAILLVWMLRKGLFGGSVGTKHVHDVGKLVFAFTVFYAYIGFSQFLLIWYAGIPESSEWYYYRMNYGWGIFLLALPFLKFIIPFLVLLPQDSKKNKRNLLVIMSGLLIVTQIYEIWIWVAPYGIDGDHQGGIAPSFPLLEIPIVLGFIGLFMVVVARSLAKHQLVPLKDPFLAESIPHSHDHLIYPNGKPDRVAQ